MFGTPVALQALGDLFGTGADARILHRRQRVTVTLASDDGAQDLLPGLAHHVGDDIGELDVHLRERFLHVLHVARLALEQHLPLPR